MRKKKSIPCGYGFSARINDDCCPLGFPKGALLKGEHVPFKNERAALRPSQLVVIRNATGKLEACCNHSANRDRVVAILRKVVLPKLSPASPFKIVNYEGKANE